MIEIPAQLRGLVADAGGVALEQPGVPVDLGRWRESVVGFEAVLSRLPGELDRVSGRAFALGCPASPQGAVAAFIASQIWGYGANGYGPFRLGRALAYPGLPRILQKVRAQVAGGDPVGAFRTLCVTHEIPSVGAAFGSKFLYFVDPHGRALILDRLVRGWLAEHAEVRLRGRRDEREYAVWLLVAEQWARALGISPGELELIIFSDGLGEGSPWTLLNTGGRSPDASVISRPSGAHVQRRTRSRVILLGCVKQKRAGRAPARDLYVSARWRARRAYAQSSGEEWLILSAKHGLLDPDQIVAPYDVALRGLDAAARRRWGERVVRALLARYGSLAGLVFEVHAGSAYRLSITPALQELGAAVVEPLAGLSIGRQLAWYRAHAGAPEMAENTDVRQRRVTAADVRRAPRPRAGHVRNQSSLAPTAGSATNQKRPLAPAPTCP